METDTPKSRRAPSPRPTVEQLHGPRHGAAGGGPSLSRRNFLLGAAGAGAVAVAGAAAFASGAFGGDSGPSIDCLAVPENAMTPLTDLQALDGYEGSVRLANSIDVPFGTLAWSNDDQVCACLLPTQSGSPLTKAGLLFMGSGTLATALEEAVGRGEGFEIYDVRATSQGMVWTEADIMQGTWRIYGTPLTDGTLGSPRLLDEGDATYETPTLGASGPYALWQKVPLATDDLTNRSQLLCAPFDGEARCLYESRRRNATPLWTGSGSAVITPRLDSPTTYHQLTRIDLASGEVTDTLTLPAAMKPLEAAYGNTGFMFSFPDIYNYGDGIANLGTYVPYALPADGDYSAQRWFGFNRTPSAPPAWAGNLLIVKSTYSVCGIDLDAGTYFAIDVENGADKYGEYLISAGSGPTFATYTNIDHAPVGEEPIHTGRIKVWEPAA